MADSPEAQKAKAALLQASKAFSSLSANLKTKAADFAGKLKAEVAKKKEAAAAGRKAEQAFIDQCKKGMEEVKAGFLAAREEYQNIVKKTDGLTSVKPSVIKAMEMLRDTLDDKHRLAAKTALENHKAEVEKANGKKDGKPKAFNDAMVKLIAGLN